MSWIGIVFLYTFGGDILYGIRHDTFIDEQECRSHFVIRELELCR